MAFQKRPFSIHNIPAFRGGINFQQSPDEIQDNELADCENFSIENDSITTAPGYSSWDDNLADNVGPYWGGVAFKKSDGTLVDVRQRQDHLEYAEDGESLWTNCTLPTTGSPASTVILTQAPCTFAQLNDVLIWTNGSDTVMSSDDGITWVLQPSLPVSRVVFENAKNRVLYLGQRDNPYTISWSGINDPLTIGVDSFQLLDPNNNGVVLGAGLSPDGTTLVFKESALYTIADYVDDGIIDMNYIGQTRLSSHQTIAATKNSVIWYAWDGFAEFIGGQIRSISSKVGIGSTTQQLYRNNVLKGSLFCAAYYNNKYRCAMPNQEISLNYNSQEYIFYTDSFRNDPTQPYPITRNKRFIGCYFIEDAEFDYGRDITLYIGDSRPETELATSGSPAVRESPIFAWINDYRETSAVGFPIELGLAGEPQEAFFTTKYFTEDIPFFVKKYKKLFLNCRFSDRADVMIGYRFDPYSSFTMVSFPVETNDIQWEYDDGTTGEFLEGFGFSQEALANLFLDIENTEKPRGIQFKVQVNETREVTIFGMAYKLAKKSKFK